MHGENSIIIFSQQSSVLDNICSVASSSGFARISVSDGKDARKLIADGDYSMALVNAPLENEFGLEIAVCAAKSGCGVIISAPAKACGDIAAKIGDMDIFILPKPLSSELLLQSFRFVMLSKADRNVLRTEKEHLEEKLRDTKLIDRAKCVLVHYLNLSESEAHKHIQKRAMDMRISQADAAREILKIYER